MFWYSCISSIQFVRNSALPLSSAAAFFCSLLAKLPHFQTNIHDQPHHQANIPSNWWYNDRNFQIWSMQAGYEESDRGFEPFRNGETVRVNNIIHKECKCLRRLEKTRRNALAQCKKTHIFHTWGKIHLCSTVLPLRDQTTTVPELKAKSNWKKT